MPRLTENQRLRAIDMLQGGLAQNIEITYLQSDLIWTGLDTPEKLFHYR